MIRTAFSICAVLCAFAFGACEKQSFDNLPEHYKQKAEHRAGASHDEAPAHGDKEKTDAGEHKS